MGATATGDCGDEMTGASTTSWAWAGQHGPGRRTTTGRRSTTGGGATEQHVRAAAEHPCENFHHRKFGGLISVCVISAY